MKIRAFITHKLAEHFSDCQDRFSISNDTKSVALADGMSQSYQQKIWATLLVNSYTSNSDFVPNRESIKELSVQWRENVVNQIQQMKEANAPEYLIIMNENALAIHKSAGATFLGIRFNGNRWEGDVLGDSCLIEIVKNKIIRILTSQDTEEFDNHPDYFDSDALKEGKGTPKQIAGEINSSTSILLVSDPFSDFLNEKKKEGKEEVYIKELLSVETHEQYEELVARWRNTYRMHNDDSTLIIIEYDGSNDFNCSNIDDIQSLILEEQHQQEVLEQPKKSVTETEKTVERLAPEIPSEQVKEEETHSAEDISQETEASSISEQEFEKIVLNEYRYTKKNLKTKDKIKNFVKGESDEFIVRKVLKIVYKKFNITKK